MWQSERYEDAIEFWPKSGKVILAQYNDNAVCVYQAFNDEIADYAIQNQQFSGCSKYSTTRMTWIKTNFLWMMFRSGWGFKKNQNRILAIWLHKHAFERYLQQARIKGSKPLGGDNIKLQWDPDHYINGKPHIKRKAIQLGLKNLSSFSNGNDIYLIEDISDFVHEQGIISKKKDISTLMVSKEREYIIDKSQYPNIFQ